LEFDQTDAGSVALRGASKTGYAEGYSRSSFSDQPPDKGVARFLSFNVQVGRSRIAAWIRMHEKEIFSGTPASENGPRDLDLRLAFGQHALRFGKTRANERRAAVRGDLIDRGAGLELHHFDARLPLECKDVDLAAGVTRNDGPVIRKSATLGV
jgi:hypothetical protein